MKMEVCGGGGKRLRFLGEAYVDRRVRNIYHRYSREIKLWPVDHSGVLDVVSMFACTYAVSACNCLTLCYLISCFLYYLFIFLEIHIPAHFIHAMAFPDK